MPSPATNGKSAASNHYAGYFRDQLAAKQGLSAVDANREIEMLVATVHTFLAGSGHSAEVVANEMAEVKAAAAALRFDTKRAEINGSRRASSGAAVPAIGDAKPVEPRRLQAAVPAPTIQKLPVKSLLSRTKMLSALAFAALFLAWLVPLVLFLRENSGIHVATPVRADELAVEISLAFADFSKDTASFRLLPASGAGITADGRFSAETTLVIEAGGQKFSHVFRQNTVLLPWTVSLPLDEGDVHNYPFDTHRANIEFGAIAANRLLQVVPAVNGMPHGLSLAMSSMPGEPAAIARLNIDRSGPVVFAVLLIVSALGLAEIAAAIMVFRAFARGFGLHPAQPAFAMLMLIAVPIVRSNLPGIPATVGDIDFAVFFWAEVLAAGQVAVMALKWNWRPTEQNFTRELHPKS